MAAPLNTCTTIEQRGVVRFLWAKNIEAKDIHKEMLPIWACTVLGLVPCSGHINSPEVFQGVALGYQVITFFTNTLNTCTSDTSSSQYTPNYTKDNHHTN
jgi:hypothetical protein